MKPERWQSGACGAPFPVHEDLVERLRAGHRTADASRDPTIAHLLGACAGYAYADIDTVATMMARLGLAENACVRVAQTVDAMFIFSTAYLVQSRCGRIVILCYRGTEPANLGNWLGNTDASSETVSLDAGPVAVHSGFYQNVRATRWAVLGELEHALNGRSLADPERSVEHPMEALYVSGHSLGGAMAVLFALTAAGAAEHRAIADRLRAVYTFGQPMALLEPMPELARSVGKRLFRHVTLRDLVPALPAVGWGRYAHFGHEFRFSDGEWMRSEKPIAQLAHLREIPRSVISFLASDKRRNSTRYTMAEHGPHKYLAALRPTGRITEFGDHR